jgi:ribbon-helix-helix CopG family protein
MPKRGRPFTYTDETERPETISLKVPRDLAERLRHHARMHGTSMSQVILEGLTMRLDTPSDPRELMEMARHDDTLGAELRQMIREEIQEALAQRATAGEPREAPKKKRRAM